MQGIVDWHSHILPGIDDGSPDISTSLQMLEESRCQGIRCIAATPHFYADEDVLENFFQRRQASYQLFMREKNLHPEFDSIEIRLGCEITWYPGIGSMEVLDQFCIEGTRLLLVEMPFTQWERQHIAEIAKMIDRGILPVIAHLERFLRFQKDKTYLDQLMSMPLILQFNGGPLLAGGLSGRMHRTSLVSLMEKSRYFVLGSDMHNTTTRPQNLKKAREVLPKLIPGRKIKRIDLIGEKYFHI